MRSIEDIIGLNIRNLDTLLNMHQNDVVAHLLKLRNNVEKVRLVSLFSGLGGAELMVELNYAAICQRCQEHGIDLPNRPRALKLWQSIML